MRKTVILVTSLIFLASSSALACAGVGITKEKLNEHLNGMEQLITADSNLEGLNLVNIVWSNIKIEAGAEGDCLASRVTASATIITADANRSYCTLTGPATSSISAVLGNHSSVELEKDILSCK